MKKKVASTLLNVAETDAMQTILNLGQPIQPVIDETLAHWSYDLDNRKPGPAYTDDGVFVGTDLDLACFLYALADRQAVINLPQYKGRRAKQVTEGEIVVSDKNRHGKILGVLANKENMSFSIRIMDMNVMTTDEVGNFRNFMIVDLDGKWYDGWQTIQFVPDAKENDFMTKNKLWSGNTVVFKNFIHPNRWISFFGQHYFTTKALLNRLDIEAAHWRNLAKELRSQGVIIGGGNGEKKEWPKKTTVGDSKSIKVPAIEVEIEHPAFLGSLPTIDNFKNVLTNKPITSKSEILKAAEDRAREITYTLIPKLRFATRATEYAFNFHGDDGNKMPAWIENTPWDRNYVVKGARKIWNRLVFARDLAIRYRKYQISEIVSAE
ncbi:MAG: hypothetical protein Q7R33_01770 [Nitrosarchaeum sp.]|nr:hypothetical protein [Nitrosarchaeum sp.]